MPLAFDPQPELTFPLVRTTLQVLQHIILLRNSNEHYDEAMVQSFFERLAELAIGYLDDASVRIATLLTIPTMDLARSLDSFHNLRVPARVIQWREETRALQISYKSSTSSRSSADRSGVRVPDLAVRLWVRSPNKSVILHVAELKIDGDDRVGHWRAGMAQAILYLAQTYEAQGTNLGTFVLETSFARLYAAERTIYLEVAGSVATRTRTIQEVFAQAETMAAEMPHDIAPRSPRSGQEIDSEGIFRSDLRALYRHLARVRDVVVKINLDNDVLRVPAHEQGAEPDPNIYLPHLLSPAADDSEARQLSDLELLDLVGAAHPKHFPKWWIEGKRQNIKDGRSDDPVPETARPRSKKSRMDPSCGPGASGGAGAGQGESGGGGDAGCPDSRDADDPAQEAGLADTTASHTLRPISPPHSDEGEDVESDAHRAHWLRQQQEVAEFLPVSAPPATSDTSPAGKGKGGVAEGTNDVKLYSAASPMLARPSLVSLHRGNDSDSDSDSDSDLDEETLTRLAAQFTLAGWRIQLVTSEEYDRVLALQGASSV